MSSYCHFPRAFFNSGLVERLVKGFTKDESKKINVGLEKTIAMQTNGPVNFEIQNTGPVKFICKTFSYNLSSVSQKSCRLQKLVAYTFEPGLPEKS
jgi:hypothetical protein